MQEAEQVDIWQILKDQKLAHSAKMLNLMPVKSIPYLENATKAVEDYQ